MEAFTTITSLSLRRLATSPLRYDRQNQNDSSPPDTYDLIAFAQYLTPTQVVTPVYLGEHVVHTTVNRRIASIDPGPVGLDG